MKSKKNVLGFLNNQLLRSYLVEKASVNCLLFK